MSFCTGIDTDFDGCRISEKTNQFCLKRLIYNNVANQTPRFLSKSPFVKGFYLEHNDITDVIPVRRVHIREVVGSSPIAPTFFPFLDHISLFVKCSCQSWLGMIPFVGKVHVPRDANRAPISSNAHQSRQT